MEFSISKVNFDLLNQIIWKHHYTSASILFFMILSNLTIGASPVLNEAQSEMTCQDADLPAISVSQIPVCVGNAVCVVDCIRKFKWCQTGFGIADRVEVYRQVVCYHSCAFYDRNIFRKGRRWMCDSRACSFVTVTVLPQVVLDLKLFIQGYYQGNGTMSPAIYNELEPSLRIILLMLIQ